MKEYHFVAPVLHQDVGMRQHYVPVPPEIAEELLAESGRRVIAVLHHATPAY